MKLVRHILGVVASSANGTWKSYIAWVRAFNTCYQAMGISNAVCCTMVRKEHEKDWGEEGDLLNKALTPRGPLTPSFSGLGFRV